MDSRTKRPKGIDPEDEVSLVDTVELGGATGGSAGSKTMTTQGGGGDADADPPDASDTPERPPAQQDLG